MKKRIIDSFVNTINEVINDMIEKMRLINSQIGEAGASKRAAQFILGQKSWNNIC